MRSVATSRYAISSRVTTRLHTLLHRPTMPHTFVIFGASGDLTQPQADARAVPAVPQEAGCRRTRGSSASRAPRSRTTPGASDLAKAVARYRRQRFRRRRCGTSLSQTIYYHAGRHRPAPTISTTLAKLLNDIEKAGNSTRVYYLATAPQFYEPADRATGPLRPGRRKRRPAPRDHRKAVRHRPGHRPSS